jgi:hypothetical protein
MSYLPTPYLAISDAISDSKIRPCVASRAPEKAGKRGAGGVLGRMMKQAVFVVHHSFKFLQAFLQSVSTKESLLLVTEYCTARYCVKKAEIVAAISLLNFLLDSKACLIIVA